MTDLLSLVMKLKPLPSEGEAGSNLWWGRAAQALFLRAVQNQDAALAEALHDGTGEVRPYTVSTLMGRFQKGVPRMEETYTLRFTAFRRDVAEALWAETGSGSLRGGERVELDHRQFEGVSVTDSESVSAWAGRSSYEALGAPFLLSKIPAPRHLALQLTSPVSFKSGGRHVPVPMPALAFGSLLDRWNACAPVSFPAEVKRYAEECLALSRYDLKTRSVPQKGLGLRVGAVGRVSFASLNYDRYWMSVLATLTEFALFCGMGVGTAQGLGQCRTLREG